MAADVLLYGNINQYSSREFINTLSNFDYPVLVLRVDTNGGDPQSMFGMVAKFKEFQGRKIIKIDGRAYSGGFFLACYSDYNECLDVSKGMVHRAAYPDWFEDSDLFTDDLKLSLKEVNASLEAAFRGKIDVAAFEGLDKMKGITVADIFSLDSRIEIFLNAEEMKQIGLVNKITKITPEIQSLLNSNLVKMAAQYLGEKTETKTSTKKNMTLSELKAQHQEVYAQAYNEGVMVGEKKEKDRVEGIMVFNEIAPEIVKEAISSGANLSEKQKNEIFMKQMSAQALEKLKTESAPAVKTPAAPKGAATEAEKKAQEISAFEKQVLEMSGYKEPVK